MIYDDQQPVKPDPRLHDFHFDRKSRRMVCTRCNGKMNECPVLCQAVKVLAGECVG